MGIRLAEATPVRAQALGNCAAWDATPDGALALSNCAAWDGGTEASEKDLENWSRAEKRKSEKRGVRKARLTEEDLLRLPLLLWACVSL